MDTYVQDNTTFEAYFALGTAHVASGRFGVGMCGVVSTAGKPYGPDPCGPVQWTPAALQERFDFLAARVSAFSALHVWVVPLSDAWWTALSNFLLAN
eukprot:m.145478 g.145478  ORF g.145478 m.145478 type:complete len:97 (-) comp20496_c3_seq1:137-427(-)